MEMELKVVISCAGSKYNKGYLTKRKDESVCFVAKPEDAPQDHKIFCYAHPDDEWEDGITYRERLLSYNEKYDKEESRLHKAYQLYKPKEKPNIYKDIVETFGEENVYILSAGWGLIKANFLTPFYNITFRSKTSYHKRRLKDEKYCDFNHLENNSDRPVIFFGGLDYLHFFCRLTKNYSGRRIVFYKSKEMQKTKFNDIELKYYNTSRNRNWHYYCAERAMKCYKVSMSVNQLIDCMINR